MPIMIIDNYDSFTYNLFQYVQELTREKVIVARNDRITLSEVLESSPSKIILSPGPGHPANERDFGVCAEILRHLAGGFKIPLLGVCLGHQGIAHYFGGKVSRAPRIMHGKISNVSVTAKSPLFNEVPSLFEAMRYHSLAAEEATLPDCLEVTARDQSDGLIMALQHKSLPIYGVQFHPESIGTPLGKTILANFNKC